uniref:Protein disulfide isomerase like, testis expressed n=1 Tax=Strix occidentalis caurina TaxID=311401 RepID=A0A8D0FWK9_STROC
MKLKIFCVESKKKLLVSQFYQERQIHFLFHPTSRCGLCNPFEFAEAARQLKKEAPRIQFGKIDVTHQHDLRKEFNIREFPTVKFFVDGSREDPIDCKGVRQASVFITWVKRRTGPSTVLINSTDQAEAIINADDFVVIGFFKVIHWKTQKTVFCETARDVPEMPFGMTASEDVRANYGIQKNTLVVFKKVGVQNGTDVESFVSQTSVKIFDVPVENHILLFTPTNSETFNAIYENYKSAAVEFRGKIMFVLVDTNETRNGRVFEYFRIRDIDVPAVRILNLTSNAKYKMPAEEVTVENLKEFCQSYLNGKAKLHLSSEEIPEDWDKMPVKVLVGKNFNRIVFNKTTTVFVMFYAPWSYDCRKLLPIWDKLGEQYESRKDIIIAKIDVTANDILSVGLDRYPFFRLFPAGPGYQVRSSWGRTWRHRCTHMCVYVCVRTCAHVRVRKESFKQENFSPHLLNTGFTTVKNLN